MPPIIRRDRLLAMVRTSSPPPVDERPRRIPYPTASQVLYDPPSPDGPKRCGTCWKYITTGACIEVAGEIAPGQVCGLYVWGTPSGVAPPIAAARKAAPAAAGLIDTPGGMGTACDACRFFTPDSNGDPFGMCAAVGAADGLPPVIVERLGCCTRWEYGGG